MIVASDHGFSLRDYNVNVTQALIDAGLKASANSDDVIVSNTGPALIHVKNRDAQKIRAIAELLKTQAVGGVDLHRGRGARGRRLHAVAR